MTSIEIGLTISVVIVVALFARLNFNPAMREATKTRSVAEMKREIDNLRATIAELTDQNTGLRNQLRIVESDLKALEIAHAALKGEMGRTTK